MSPDVLVFGCDGSLSRPTSGRLLSTSDQHALQIMHAQPIELKSIASLSNDPWRALPSSKIVSMELSSVNRFQLLKGTTVPGHHFRSS